MANPQTLWKQFKDDIREIAKKHNKESRAKTSKRMTLIREDMNQLTNHPNLDTNDEIHHNEVFLANELAHLEKIQARDHGDELRATITHHGEVLGGIWSAINKERKPQVIRVPGAQQSNQVGELAAVIVAITSIAPFDPLTIITDSRYVIEGLTTHLSKWEVDSWIRVKWVQTKKNLTPYPWMSQMSTTCKVPSWQHLNKQPHTGESKRNAPCHPAP